MSPLSITGGRVFTSATEILVRRPIDEVFAYVADARNRPQWDDSVVSEELTSPEPIGVAPPSAPGCAPPDVSTPTPGRSPSTDRPTG